MRQLRAGFRGCAVAGDFAEADEEEEEEGEGGGGGAGEWDDEVRLRQKRRRRRRRGPGEDRRRCRPVLPGKLCKFVEPGEAIQVIHGGGEDPAKPFKYSSNSQSPRRLHVLHQQPVDTKEC